MSLYFEIHVTIEYPGEEETQRLREATAPFSEVWHMGDLLLMKRDDERSHKDLFFTARSFSLDHAVIVTAGFIQILKDLGYKPIRYKIEDTVVDSRIEDELKLL